MRKISLLNLILLCTVIAQGIAIAALWSQVHLAENEHWRMMQTVTVRPITP